MLFGVEGCVCIDIVEVVCVYGLKDAATCVSGNGDEVVRSVLFCFAGVLSLMNYSVVAKGYDDGLLLL